MVNETAVEIGSDFSFEVGHALGGAIFELTHPANENHPSNCHIAFVFRKCTHDELHDGGSMFQKGHRWERRKPPSTIRPRTTVGWVAENNPELGGNV